MNIFSLIRVFQYHVLGIGLYINEKFSDAGTKRNYNTRFVSNQKLVHPNVRTSKTFKSSVCKTLQF